jgi:hypothetical protein
MIGGNNMKDFMQNARHFIRNPLGIIALFISLVYGLACILFINTVNSIPYQIILILTIFITIFPVFILASFTYLVIFWPKHLYGPGDYKDEKNFIESLSLKRKEARIDAEISQIKQSSDSESTGIRQETEAGKEVLDSQGQNTIGVKEADEKAKLDSEKKMHPQFKINGSVLRTKYIIAEQFAIDKLEKEYNTVIKRQVSIKLPNNKHVEVDGFFQTENFFYFIEVKYIVDSNNIDRIKGSINDLYLKLVDTISTNLKIIVVIVYENSPIDKIKGHIESYFTDNRILHFEYFEFNNLININELTK